MLGVVECPGQGGGLAQPGSGIGLLAGRRKNDRGISDVGYPFYGSVDGSQQRQHAVRRLPGPLRLTALSLHGGDNGKGFEAFAGGRNDLGRGKGFGVASRRGLGFGDIAQRHQDEARIADTAHSRHGIVGKAGARLRGEDLSHDPVAHVRLGDGLGTFRRLVEKAARRRRAEAVGRIARRVCRLGVNAANQSLRCRVAQQCVARRFHIFLAHAFQAIQEGPHFDLRFHLHDQLIGNRAVDLEAGALLEGAHGGFGLQVHAPVRPTVVEPGFAKRFLDAAHQGIGGRR